MAVDAIVLLGAPGAGKGTAAEGIRERTPYVHLATGDLLREAMKAGTPIGKQAEAYVKRGELVPDDVILKLVEGRMDAGGPKASFMFDGFPRTLQQATMLENSLARRDGRLRKVFFLDASREVLVQRLTGRRICRQCGRNFHMVNLPPKRAGVCDACGGELYQRADDQEATILNRLDVFRKQTEALIAYYEKKGLLVRVDSAQSRDALIDRILTLLKSS